MNWDIDKIEQEYTSLDQMTETPRIVQDKNNLADMINYHYGEEKIEPKPVNIKLYTPEFFKTDAMKLNEEVRNMTFSICRYQDVKMPVKLFSICKRMSIEDFDKVVENYLINHNTGLLEIYRRYKEENRIELRKYRYKGSTTSGRCYYFDNVEGNYLSAVYKGTLNNSSVLVHEIAHAGTIEQLDDKVKRQNYALSNFCEALSIYNELLYADFLIKKEKIKEGSNIFANILDTFTLIFDYIYAELLDMEQTSFPGKKSVMIVLSKILAFRLYYIHYIDPQEEANQIRKLESMLGKNTDYEIFKEFKLEEAKKYLDFTFNKYLEFKDGSPKRKNILL